MRCRQYRFQYDTAIPITFRKKYQGIDHQMIYTFHNNCMCNNGRHLISMFSAVWSLFIEWVGLERKWWGWIENSGANKYEMC